MRYIGARFANYDTGWQRNRACRGRISEEIWKRPSAVRQLDAFESAKTPAPNQKPFPFPFSARWTSHLILLTNAFKMALGLTVKIEATPACLPGSTRHPSLRRLLDEVNVLNELRRRPSWSGFWGRPATASILYTDRYIHFRSNFIKTAAR
jgi:hypothetical protein